MQTNGHNLQRAPDARPVFGYVRVSTDRQETERQEQTLPQRHATLPDGLNENPLELFYDHGISAWSGKARPQFEEMHRRIVAGEASALLIDTSSRLTRQGMRAALQLFFSYQDARTRVFTTQGKEYLFDLGGIISVIVDAEADERYSANLSHNTSTGKHTLSALGYWPHGKVPLGYVAVPAPDNPSRKILALSDAADAVREAFRRFDEEYANQRDLVRYLNDELGLKQSRYFARAMLSNPSYLGKVKCGDGKVFDGRHPALVSDERFERIQRRLARASAEHHKPPKKWPFARIARCASCGSTLRFRKLKGRYTYLFCSDPGFPAKECRQKAIPAPLFEANFAFYLGAIGHGLRLHLDADPAFAVPESGNGALADAKAVLAVAVERYEELTGLVIDGAIKRADSRYQHAKAARDAAEEAVARLSLQARSYRDELEQFVQSVERLATLPPVLEDWIKREHPAMLTASGSDVLGDRFAHRAVLAWQHADLTTKRALVERTFDRIEAGPDGLTLHFRTALPGPLALPALFGYDADDRADVEAEGFGELDSEAVSLVGTAPT